MVMSRQSSGTAIYSERSYCYGVEVQAGKAVTIIARTVIINMLFFAEVMFMPYPSFYAYLEQLF